LLGERAFVNVVEFDDLRGGVAVGAGAGLYDFRWPSTTKMLPDGHAAKSFAD
jgi:hypothetical protein